MHETIEIVVTVKAYPSLSKTYGEVVCVAGIRTDLERPEWVRLFPVAFRDLPFTHRFHKYDVIRLEAAKHSRDPRPETYRPNVESIEVVGKLDTKKGWAKRRPYIEPLIVNSMCELRRRQQKDGTSLGVIRPGKVLDLTIEDAPGTWDQSKQLIANQPSLFFADKKGIEKIPHQVRYRYRCDETGCAGHHQMIIDWELAQSFRDWRKRYDAKTLLEKIRERWLDEMCRPDKETLFFVGNQHLQPTSFLVLGVFWPPASTSS
jgi:hypothetical protein